MFGNTKPLLSSFRNKELYILLKTKYMIIVALILNYFLKFN